MQDNNIVGEESAELPMIVWLRGDEDYFTEFSLTAEDAMSEIGIKRSRLTQISGRELRVGKVRVDRYLKPVYRKADISAYMNHIRAPVAHVKSSKIADEAIQGLQSAALELKDLKTELANVTGRVVARKVTPELRQLQKQQQSWMELFDKISRFLMKQVRSVRQSQELLRSDLDELKGSLEKIASEMDLFNGQLVEISGWTRSLHRQSVTLDRVAEVEAEIQELRKLLERRLQLDNEKNEVGLFIHAASKPASIDVLAARFKATSYRPYHSVL